MTPQQEMKAKLEGLGIPHNEIRVYGSQITITAAGFDTAQRWSVLLAKFAKVKACRETTDRTKRNKGSRALPSIVKVWRIWATV